MSVRLHGTFGSWVLIEGEAILGRGSECGLRIDDPRLSRRHATFSLRGHRLEVHDLGSTNGVLVDGTRIDGRRELRHGEVVVCGPVVLMVSIDQTAPHPRRIEGGQDPTTRRTAPRADTETMLAATAADRPAASGASRGLNPAIAAAISGSGTHDPARQSALQPVDQPGSMTSPLAALRHDPSAPTPTARRSPTTTSSTLEPPPLDPTATGALEAPQELPPARTRLLAAAVDGLVLAVAVLPAIPVLLLGWAAGLRMAGAAVVDGLPHLAAGTPAPVAALAGSLASPEGLARAWALLPVVSADPGVRGVLAGAAGCAAMVAALALMLVLIHPTVVRGAPAGHRRHGIRIAILGSAMRPGWGRAIVRWGLALLLWPLAVPAIALGRRGPHDVLSGCMPVRTR